MNELTKLFKRKITKDFSGAVDFNKVDLTTYFNHLSNLWHPNELIKKIGGRRNFALLYKDTDIYSAVDKRMTALLTSSLQLDGLSPEITKWFEKQLLPHEIQLKEAAWWAVFNGYSVIQIIYNKDGSVLGFQEENFYQFKPEKDLLHVRVVDSADVNLINQVMPYGKFVLVSNKGSYNNPYGVAIAERLILPWIFKCNGIDLWQDFAKRFANGYMHGRVEDGDQGQILKTQLEESGKSAIIVTDKNTELEMIQPNRDSNLYEAMKNGAAKDINKVVLGETQTSDMQERGSSASADVHNEVRQEKTWADIKLVERAFKEIIRQIGDMNGIAPDLLPVPTLVYDPDFSIQQVTRDRELHSMGVRFKKSYLKKTYDLDEEDYELTDTDTNPYAGLFNKKATSTFLKADEMKQFINLSPGEGQQARRSHNEQDEIVQLLQRNAERPIPTEDLIAAIRISKDEKELEENLSLLVLNRNQGFADDLGKALYLSAARGAMYSNPKNLKDEEKE